MGFQGCGHSSDQVSHLPAGAYFGRVVRQAACGGFSLVEIHHAARARFPRHTHERAYLCLLLAGSYRETIGAKAVEFSPATLAAHPASLDHWDEIGDRGGQFFNVEIDRHAAVELFGAKVQTLGAGPVADPVAIMLMLRLYRSYAMRRLDPMYRDSLFAEAVAAEVWAATLRVGSLTERRNPRWLSRVVEHLRHGGDSVSSMRALATEAGVHPVHLARTFRRAHGCTMAQYRARARVQRACALLAERQSSLATIAADVGFADQSHMTRVFAGLVGCSPGVYRRLVAPERSEQASRAAEGHDS